MKLKMEKEAAEKEKFDQLMKMKEQDDKKLKQKELKERQTKLAQENKAVVDDQRKLEEEEHMNKLELRMQNILYTQQLQETPKKYALSDKDLGIARCRMLAQNIEFNYSDFTLYMARKNILDHDRISLAFIHKQRRQFGSVTDTLDTNC